MDGDNDSRVATHDHSRRFPTLPSSRPVSPESGDAKAGGPTHSSPTWTTILGELHRAMDDSSVPASSSSASAAPCPSSHHHLAPAGALAHGAPRGRKRVRSHRRSLSVGAEPCAFGAEEEEVPLRLDPDHDDPASVPSRVIRGFHPHLYHLRLSAGRPSSTGAEHAVAPRRSSPALLASPIRLMSGLTLNPPSPSPTGLSSSLPRELEPTLESRTIRGESPSLSPPANIALSPSLPASPSDSPGSWLRSPPELRPRFRSDGSDMIMFTPRQLDFDHEGDSIGRVMGRRLEWNHFEIGDDSEQAPSTRGGLQSFALGPAFSPSDCSREQLDGLEHDREPPSPAFALETEPGVGTS